MPEQLPTASMLGRFIEEIYGGAPPGFRAAAAFVCDVLREAAAAAAEDAAAAEAGVRALVESGVCSELLAGAPSAETT